MFDSRPPANMARLTYLDPRAKDFFVDWNRAAKECVAALRTRVGRDPHDRDLSDLVGEFSTQSEEFAELWATHNVRLHRNVEKHFTPTRSWGHSRCGMTASRLPAMWG
jgi:MmyB-like transcription regulator ligand binding domain